MSTTLPAYSRAPDGTAYVLIGPENAPVLTLIHGLGLAGGIWVDFLAPLTKNNRVLVYDLYGHGSSMPSNDTLSLTDFSDQLARLLDHLEIARTSVVGFSIGGMINRRFAMDHADRVSSLMILNSPHDRGEVGQKTVEDRALTVRESGSFATLEDALKRWFTQAFRDRSATAIQSVRDWRAQADPESYAQAAWVLAHGVRELINPTPPIVCPTLVITCENDTGSTPEMGKKIHSEINGSEIKIIPKLQHLGLIEKPELFIELILDFLERTPE